MFFKCIKKFNLELNKQLRNFKIQLNQCNCPFHPFCCHPEKNLEHVFKQHTLKPACTFDLPFECAQTHAARVES